jgi:hypothetical protein
MAGQLGDNGSPAPLLDTSPSRIHQSVSRLELPAGLTGVDGNNDVNADEPTAASQQRQLFPELEAPELRERKRKLALANLITGQGNLDFVERASRALIAALGLAEITLNATNPGIFNQLPKHQKVKVARGASEFFTDEIERRSLFYHDYSSEVMKLRKSEAEPGFKIDKSINLRSLSQTARKFRPNLCFLHRRIS